MKINLIKICYIRIQEFFLYSSFILFSLHLFQLRFILFSLSLSDKFIMFHNKNVNDVISKIPFIKTILLKIKDEYY